LLGNDTGSRIFAAGGTMRLRALALAYGFGIVATFAALPIHADDAPAILDVEVSPLPVLGGEQAVTTVCTTPDVLSVEARVGIMRIPIPRVAPGRFVLVRDIPPIPRIFRHIYQVTFVARSADGIARTRVGVDVR
jgi:hypothetical protein